MTTPVCPYCSADAVLVPDSEVYSRSYGRKVWACKPCDAHVGCHLEGAGDRPLGRLANKELRTLKVRCHELFDPIWRGAMTKHGWGKGRARNNAYGLLAKRMGIPQEECHFGMMDEARCAAAIAILMEAA